MEVLPVRGYVADCRQAVSDVSADLRSFSDDLDRLVGVEVGSPLALEDAMWAVCRTSVAVRAACAVGERDRGEASPR